MSAEETRAGLEQVNATTQLAIADLAVPQEGHAVHEAAGREIAGAGDSIEQRVTAIMHHLEVVRRTLGKIDDNNQKIVSLLPSLPKKEHNIGETVDRATQEVDKLRTISIFSAVRALQRCLGLSGDFQKLGSIVKDAPDVTPAVQMLDSAHGINEAIQATL